MMIHDASGVLKSLHVHDALAICWKLAGSRGSNPKASACPSCQHKPAAGLQAEGARSMLISSECGTGVLRSPS